MPAHIYSMTGLWEDSITSNLSALSIQPDYYHAADFTVYAHLQLAQDAKAAAMVEKATTTPVRGDRPVTMVQLHGAGSHAGAAAPSSGRTGKRRRRWPSPPPTTRRPTRSPASRAGWAWPALATAPAPAGDRGDGIAAERAGVADSAYWADRTTEQILAVSAWVALAEGAKVALSPTCAVPPTARTPA